MATSVAVTLPMPTLAAATAFTVARLREFVTTTLSDAVLQTYLDAAMDAIDDALGPLAVTERLSGRGDLLMLSQEAESITTIVEDARWGALTLADDDYELTSTGQMLIRLSTGTTPGWYWKGRVDVTYVRADAAAVRIRVAVALVQLDITHAPGLASQQIGTWSESYATGKPYAEQRAEILASLAIGGAWIV